MKPFNAKILYSEFQPRKMKLLWYLGYHWSDKTWGQDHFYRM